MHRRRFLTETLATLAAGAAFGAPLAGCRRPPAARSGEMLMTVTGAVPVEAAGIVLPHEHILVSLSVPGPYDPDDPDLPEALRYDREDVVDAALPHVRAAMEAGVRTLVEATPAWLGRDPEVLRRLSQTAGLNILTNTGYYGARDDRHLPPHARSASVDRLAAEWIREAEDGIDDTGVRPGFIKIGVDPGPLSTLDARLTRAAARAHRETGLVIASHTGPAAGVWDQLQILEQEGVAPDAWIWVHAQAEPDLAAHVEAARRGAWVELDGIHADTVERHVELVVNLYRHALLHRVLVSHDAGWYSIGEPDGGDFRGYTTLFTEVLPRLREEGLSDEDIDRLIRVNPARAFAIRRAS